VGPRRTAKLNIAEVKPYLESDTEKTDSLSEIPRGEIDQGIEHVRDILLGTTDFNRGPNTAHADMDLIDIASDACRERVRN